VIELKISEKHQNIEKTAKLRNVSIQKILVIDNINEVDLIDGFLIFLRLLFQLVNSRIAVETQNKNSPRKDMIEFRIA
jgi:hypothetical protein